MPPFPFSLGSRILSNSLGMPPELPCCFRVCLSNQYKLTQNSNPIRHCILTCRCQSCLALLHTWPDTSVAPFCSNPPLKGPPKSFLRHPLPIGAMGKRAKPTAAVSADEASRFASKMVKMAQDDTEDQILELIRKDPSLGPKVLMMLQKGMLCQQPTDVDRIPSCANKWNLLGKDRCVSLLCSLSDQLTAQVLEKWPKKDVETLLAFSLDVEDASALPSKRMAGVQQWVRTRVALVGDRLQSLVFTEDTPKRVDWQKFGVFEIIPAAGGEGKLIRHRMHNDLKVALPAELAAAPNLSLVGNYSASKAMLKTDLTQVSVLKIFRRENVELPMPLFEKAVSDAASSPRSATLSCSDEPNLASPRSAPESASPVGVPFLPLPRGNGSAARAVQHEQEE